MAGHDCPLILTLQLDPASFAWVNGLRERHFPVERNRVPAHLTLFHALPGAEDASIRAALAEVAHDTPALSLRLTEPFFLGRGVAIGVRSERLKRLHADLARRFHPWLTPQDRQGFRPHVTIQNKVAPETARRLQQQLASEWADREGAAYGMHLWRYLGGPWEPAGDFRFLAQEDAPD